MLFDWLVEWAAKNLSYKNERSDFQDLVEFKVCMYRFGNLKRKSWQIIIFLSLTNSTKDRKQWLSPSLRTFQLSQPVYGSQPWASKL